MNTLQKPTVNAWHLQVGKQVCTNAQVALDREWLVTNGLGGYAAGSLVGATTRSYHGLLVASLHPPVERTVFVTKVDEEVILPKGRTLKLGVNEYQDGTLEPQGYNYLESVALEGDVICFTYALDAFLVLEKRVWMEYGRNTTYVQYTLRGTLDSDDDASSLTLTLFPFCLSRDYHSTTRGSEGWHFLIEHHNNQCQVRADATSPLYHLIMGTNVTYSPTGYWYWHVHHRRDRERGLPEEEDVYQPGTFRLQITPGMRASLVLSAETTLPTDFGSAAHEDAVQQALVRHQRRIRQLLVVADRSTNSLQRDDPVQARLVVAADQFIVARPDYSLKDGVNWTTGLPLSPNRKTIIAGYPWFTDWGRDSMIALPGLMLSTGRYSEARGLLKAFASFARDGLIPNRFPDGSKEPEYNTIDATLWMFHAINRYLHVTHDWSLLKDLFPTLVEIIQWHVRGTIYNIGVDPADGLLHGGVPGIQLTWMDAKVGDWVVTPRHGKPVEVNALWYCALTCMESWAVRLSIDASQYSVLRSQVGKHFAERFWYEEGGYLYDVVDVEGVAGKNDASLRPNQLFAASLTHELLTEEQMARMLQKVTEHLLIPVGLRSLSPTDANYHSHFNGNPTIRDTAYHQGAAWQWLIGPYIDVHLRVYNDRSALRRLLLPLVQRFWVACIGTISEVAEPEPPFTAAGCFAQAWSIAELLRCWLLTK